MQRVRIFLAELMPARGCVTFVCGLGSNTATRPAAVVHDRMTQPAGFHESQLRSRRSAGTGVAAPAESGSTRAF